MDQTYYAHSLKGMPPSEWQSLDEHLRNVAEKARSLAEVFGAGDWAYLAGLWHDLGKYSEEFQQMLHDSATPESADVRKTKRIDHSSAGGRHAANLWRDVGKLLAYTIVGHHAGLPDGKHSTGSDLAARLDPKRTIPDISDACSQFLKTDEKPKFPITFKSGRVGFQLAFFIRMFYSCLVDADFLDTQQFLDSERASLREDRPVLASLEELLFSRLREFKPDTDINRKRADILQCCVDAAAKAPGLFTLTVPTGGGKTLSSLAFALRHSLTYQKDRIIYIIPFTSIIEQNAAVFRSILGDEAVLEHHSNYTPDKMDADETDDSIQAKRHRMACENWDAPVIVTTNVQFFDSLFANRSSKCRKLHNVANSVIILDEAQMLPEPYLRPCLEAIRELTRNYGCTIVLCTATQPALIKSPAFPLGLSEDRVTEITADPQELHLAFKRVHLKNIGRLSDDRLAEELAEQDGTLCIVNTRQRAYNLFQLIRTLPGAHHLSARMCPAHRSEVLTGIRKSLEKDEPCRVVATQLVEAGVDLDFPVVFREMAGLDAIAQAAGRCNRNAKVDAGEVSIFLPEDGRIPRLFRRAAGAADSVLGRFEDPFAPEAMTDYFRHVYWLAGDELDKKQILSDLESGVLEGDFPFRQIAERFRLIESDMIPVIVPWNDKAEKLIDLLEYAEFPGSVLRRLQPYMVQIYPHEFVQLQTDGAIYMIQDRYAALVSLVPFYQKDSGLTVSPAKLKPDDYIF
ncbi:MAG: CRISPR-associated helicase Cas3' [Thermodesulfobacteriota bacterium]|nr:CRISPR-associated helicase Cas3' [Thermodesulfobacteriota bacterium]